MNFRKKKFLLAALVTAVMTAQGIVHAEEVSETETQSAVNDSAKKIIFDSADFSSEKFEQPKYLVEGIAGEVVKKVLPLSIEARFYSPHFDINVKSDKIFYNGGSVGLKENLGFGNDNAPEFILRFKRVSLDYIHLSGNGERTFSGTDVLTFGGRRFHGQVNSKNKFDYLKLSVNNKIVSAFGSGVDWTYGITGMFWKGSVRGSDTTGRYEERSESYAVPVPTLGVSAYASLLPELKAYANISGLPLGGYGHFYDFETGLRYNPMTNLAVTAGYRRIHANVHHKEDSGNFTLNGLFGGLRLDF